MNIGLNGVSKNGMATARKKVEYTKSKRYKNLFRKNFKIALPLKTANSVPSIFNLLNLKNWIIICSFRNVSKIQIYISISNQLESGFLDICTITNQFPASKVTQREQKSIPIFIKLV